MFDIALIQRFVKIYKDSCSTFFTRVNDFKKMLESFHRSFQDMDHCSSENHKNQFTILREIISENTDYLDKVCWKGIMDKFKENSSVEANKMIINIEKLDGTSFSTFINRIVNELEKTCDTFSDFDKHFDDVIRNFRGYQSSFGKMTEKTKNISKETWKNIKDYSLSACKEEKFSQNIISTTIKSHYNIDQLLEEKSIIKNLGEFEITEASKDDEEKVKKIYDPSKKNLTPMEKEMITREEKKEREELRKLIRLFVRSSNDYQKTIIQVYGTNASRLIKREIPSDQTNIEKKDKVEYTLGNWLMQSHIDDRIVEGFKRTVTVIIPDNSWQRLLQEALLSNVVRLDDIIPFIPRKMELEFLNHQIIESVHSYQSTNRSAEAVITELKSRFTEQQKKLETTNENEIEIDSSCYCEFCKEPIYQGRFIVFPCHHAVHIRCFLENMDLYFSPADQLNLIALQSSALRKTSDREELINQLSRSCPMCGELSINILNKGFTINDPVEEKQWSLI